MGWVGAEGSWQIDIGEINYCGYFGKIAKLGKSQIKLLDMWMDIDQFSPDLGSCRYMKSSFYAGILFTNWPTILEPLQEVSAFPMFTTLGKKHRWDSCWWKTSNLPGPWALRHPFWTGTLGICLRDVSLVRSEGKSLQIWRHIEEVFC